MSVGPLHLSYYNNHNINPLELCNNEFSCFFCVEKNVIKHVLKKKDKGCAVEV